MRVERFRAALLSILIIASLMTPIMTLLSVGPASAGSGSEEPYYIIIRGDSNSYTEDKDGDPPWKSYEAGDNPPIMAAKEVGQGAVVLAGLGRNANGGVTYSKRNWTAGELDVLFDLAFRWMKPDNVAPIKVLWYGEYGAGEYEEVFNDADLCSWLIDNLEAEGYTVSDTIGDGFTPITSSLLEPYDILVLPGIQLGDMATGGDPTRLPDTVVGIIESFVEGGGGLFLMESSDYDGHNYYKVQNKILRALGFEILLQDDAISDPDSLNPSYPNAVFDAEVTSVLFGADYQAATGKTTIQVYKVPSLAEPFSGVEVKIIPKYQASMPGSALAFSVSVTNLGKDPDNYTLDIGDSAGWGPTISTNRLENAQPGVPEIVTLSVTIPGGAEIGAEDNITVTATSEVNPELSDSYSCIVRAARQIAPPIDDTYTHAARPTISFGGMETLYAGYYTEGSERAWLKFDLSVLPAGTTIDKAKLWVYNYTLTGWGSYGVQSRRVDNDDWSEGTINWNNQPAYGAMLGDVIEVTDTGWYSWDVTSFVQQEFAGDKEVSFCLRDIGEDAEPDHSTWFASKEYDDYDKWPYLEIPLPRAVDVSIKPWIQDNSPGGTLTYTVIVTNKGTESDSYSLTVSDNAVPSWGPVIEQTQSTNVPYGENWTTTLTVTIPSDAPPCTKDTITVTATSQADPTVSDSDNGIAHAFEGDKLPPTDDAHVSSGLNYQNSIFGDENTLCLQSDSYTLDYMNERIFLKFDLSTIPSGSTITEAEVWLWSQKAELADINAQCWSVTDDTWSESLVTWGTQPTRVAVLDTVTLKYSPPSEDMWLLWNVTSFVQEQRGVDNIASFSIRAEVEGASGRYRFASKEWPDTSVHPHLKVTYTLPIVRDVEVSISPSSDSGLPEETLTFTVTVKNTGEAEDNFDLTVDDNAGWSLTLSENSLTNVENGASRTVTLTVTIPSDAADGDSTEITVTVTGTGVSDSASCTAAAKAAAEFPIVYPIAAVVIIVVILGVVLMKRRP